MGLLHREVNHGPLFELGRGIAGGEVSLNPDRLIETRLLLQANSGAGKSWALRRILEQTHGAAQQIVLDVEDEFHTLREKYDYVLAGRHGGDCPADVKSASLLARRLLELGVSAIIGIYELRAHDRVRFVRLFLESMVNAPRELWHPVLVVVDEAHMFCPQQGQAESAGAVIDLMTRGRKRGYCGVLATQRISKLHKDAAAEANNKLIGRSALDVDMKRAADELGFSTKDDQRRLRTLKPGRFFAFGPAISDEVVELQVGGVETTHPRAGQRAAPPAPPRQRVKKILAQLADLPEQAEKEAQSVRELQSQIKTLNRELRQARGSAPDPQAIANAKAKGEAEGLARARRELKSALAGLRVGVVERLDEGIAAALAVEPRPPAHRDLPVRHEPQVSPTAARPHVETTGDLSGPEQRILDALAWLEGVGVESADIAAVAFLAGYRPGGGAFNNPRGRLRKKGLVQYVNGSALRITEDGRAAANPPEIPPTNEGLQASVLARLNGPEQKILRPLLDAYPGALSNEELAERAGYGAGGGAFNNPRGRLRTLGLIEYPERGQAVARDILFPEEA